MPSSGRQTTPVPSRLAPQVTVSVSFGSSLWFLFFLVKHTRLIDIFPLVPNSVQCHGTRRLLRRRLQRRRLPGHRPGQSGWSGHRRGPFLWHPADRVELRHLQVEAIPAEGSLQCRPATERPELSDWLCASLRPIALCHLSLKSRVLKRNRKCK